MKTEAVRAHLNAHDHYAAHSGMTITEAGPGTATARMTIGKEHTNSVNIVHGGVMFTLADFAFACASNSYGRIAVSTSATIYFHRPVQSGTLFAVCKEISRGKTLAVYEVAVTDGEGNRAATFTGMVYQKDTPLPLKTTKDEQ